MSLAMSLLALDRDFVKRR